MTDNEAFEIYYEQSRKEYGKVRINPQQFAKEMFEERSVINNKTTQLKNI